MPRSSLWRRSATGLLLFDLRSKILKDLADISARGR